MAPNFRAISSRSGTRSVQNTSLKAKRSRRTEQANSPSRPAPWGWDTKQRWCEFLVLICGSHIMSNSAPIMAMVSYDYGYGTPTNESVGKSGNVSSYQHREPLSPIDVSITLASFSFPIPYGRRQVPMYRCIFQACNWCRCARRGVNWWHDAPANTSLSRRNLRVFFRVLLATPSRAVGHGRRPRPLPHCSRWSPCPR